MASVLRVGYGAEKLPSGARDVLQAAKLRREAARQEKIWLKRMGKSLPGLGQSLPSLDKRPRDGEGHVAAPSTSALMAGGASKRQREA